MYYNHCQEKKSKKFNYHAKKNAYCPLNQRKMPVLSYFSLVGNHPDRSTTGTESIVNINNCDATGTTAQHSEQRSKTVQ
jgi:hypothetical protein